MTSRDRDAAHESVLRFTSSFLHDDAALIPTTELRERIARHERVILVDVRTTEEQLVSMIPGSVSQSAFEADVLPTLLDGTERAREASPLVVPYCTVGYRSGMYCRELTRAHKLHNVRNGEGIIMWTFDGGSLVRPVLGPNAEPWHAPQVENENAADAKPNSAWVPANGDAEKADVVHTLHVYGQPWDFAADGYSTVYYSRAAGAWHFARSKCGGGVDASVALWLWTLVVFYLLFTPACGVMYKCACRIALTKWGQVETCNIFHSTAHKCPWCSCTGIACLLVSSDSKALRDVPLLDMLPDGCFLTVVTVLVVSFAWRRIDKCFAGKQSAAGGRSKAPSRSICSVLFAVKALVPVVWFILYTVIVGALFFAFSSDYPYFFGQVRDVE